MHNVHEGRQRWKFYAGGQWLASIIPASFKEEHFRSPKFGWLV